MYISKQSIDHLSNFSKTLDIELKKYGIYIPYPLYDPEIERLWKKHLLKEDIGDKNESIQKK